MWEDNTKMDLKEVEWGGVDWIGLPCGRAALKMTMNFRVP
jgi:hypothetical protein